MSLSNDLINIVLKTQSIILIYCVVYKLSIDIIISCSIVIVDDIQYDVSFISQLQSNAQ